MLEHELSLKKAQYEVELAKVQEASKEAIAVSEATEPHPKSSKRNDNNKCELVQPSQKGKPIQIAKTTSDQPTSQQKSRISAPRWILRNDRLVDWRPSGKHPVTNEQQTILNLLWNHIRAGTMDPLPVRQVEKEFTSFNKKLETESEYSSFEPEEVKPECCLERYDEEAPLLPIIFQDQIFPTYFVKIGRWNKAYQLIQTGRWEDYVHQLYGLRFVEALKDKAVIIKTSMGCKVLIKGNLIPEMFNELFEFGFIRYFKVDNHAQVGHCPKPVRDFVKFLGTTKDYRDTDCDIWIRVYSAPPLHHHREWRSLSEAKDRRRPLIYPSVHILQETIIVDFQKKLDKEFCGARLQFSPDQQYWERSRQMQKLDERAIDFTQHYTWKDAGRILCRARLGYNRDSLAIALAKGGLMPASHKVGTTSPAPHKKRKTASPSSESPVIGQRRAS